MCNAFAIIRILLTVMKKLFLTLATVAMTCSGLFAQEQETSTPKYNSLEGPRNSVALSYGYLTLPDLAMAVGLGLGAGIAAGVSGGTASIGNIQFAGCYALEYYRFAGKHWELGALFSVDPVSFDNLSKDSEGQVVVTSTEYTTFLVFMPSVRYRWVDRKHVAMYSRLSAGVLAAGGDSWSFTPSVHVSPIGCEAGGEHFRGFAEIGLGMNGLITLGIRGRF